MSGAGDGRVAIVTGAASGIGRATSEQLAAQGGSVVAVDSDGETLSWADGAERVIGRCLDVTSDIDNAAMVETALERFGGLDVLALNAGVGTAGSLEDLPLESFEHCLAVNLRGVVLGLRAALPALRRSRSASVVVTASISGLAADPGMWAYNTAKGAVVNFVRAASLELAGDGICVNAVCPGPTRTRMTAMIEANMPEAYEGLRRQIPLQRWGEPEDVAAAICFLASPEASFVTGVLLPVDGGVMASTGMFAPPFRSP